MSSEKMNHKIMKLLHLGVILFACAPGLLEAQTVSKPVDVIADTYSYRTDAESVEQLGDVVCFNPLAGSRFRHTRPPNDQRMMWFCFANTADAKRMLRIPPDSKIKDCGLEGQATVEIDEHQTGKEDTDDFDLVRLLAVHKHTKTGQIACSR